MNDAEIVRFYNQIINIIRELLYGYYCTDNFSRCYYPAQEMSFMECSKNSHMKLMFRSIDLFKLPVLRSSPFTVLHSSLHRYSVHPYL